jgi:hypothetical protein
MTWDDYAKWCLSASHNSDFGASKTSVHFAENHDEQGQAELIAVDANEAAKMMSNSTSTVNKSSDCRDSHHSIDGAIQQDDEQSQSPTNHTDQLSSLPPPAPAGCFFKGYLAWCLWGHIPFSQSGSTSSLFTDAKVDASFGRNSGARAALKRKADSVLVTPKNARKKVQEVNGGTTSEAASLCDSSITTATTNRHSGFEASIGEMMGILTKTLSFHSSMTSLWKASFKNMLY